MRNSTTTRFHAALLILAATALIAGCGGDKAETETAVKAEVTETASALTPEQDALVQKIAALAKAIEAAPENAARLLLDAGLTAEELETEIYRISADPVLAHAYEEARK